MSSIGNMYIPTIHPFYLILVAGIFLLSCATSSEKEAYRSWTTCSGDLTVSKYSALDQINKQNVSSLQPEPAWIFSTGDLQEGRSSTIECNPIIVGEQMYITSLGLALIALNAITGKEN